MKTYREYLAESKKVFSYRIRIADCEWNPELQERIEAALNAYDLQDITKAKSLPIARTREFPQLGPVGRHQFEIVVNYPARWDQIQQAIHAGANIPAGCIHVVDLMSDEMNDDQMNDDQMSDHEEGPILTKEELPTNDGQNVVGQKQVDSLLKQLSKSTSEQYKGVNDEILAKSMPTEKAAVVDTKIGTTSPVGSIKNKLQGPRGK